MHSRIMTGLVALALYGTSGAALADWTGKGELGASVASGNSENESANAALEVKNSYDKWAHTVGLAGNYGNDGTVTTAQRWEFRGQSDYKFTDRAYGFGAGRYEDDGFSAARRGIGRPQPLDGDGPQGRGRLPEPVVPAGRPAGAVGGEWGWGGRNVHYGVRGHAMAAVSSGVALHGGLVPFSATFFTFSDYMKPAIRLASMMGLRSIYVFTHDSIGVGEDGPTHQPIEHAAALRGIPRLAVIRPADANETASAWTADNASSRAAALAYSAVFSLAPMLLIGTVIVPLLMYWYGNCHFRLGEASAGECACVTQSAA